MCDHADCRSGLVQFPQPALSVLRIATPISGSPGGGGHLDELLSPRSRKNAKRTHQSAHDELIFGRNKGVIIIKPLHHERFYRPTPLPPENWLCFAHPANFQIVPMFSIRWALFSIFLSICVHPRPSVANNGNPGSRRTKIGFVRQIRTGAAPRFITFQHFRANRNSLSATPTMSAKIPTCPRL
jgi:hypothetical protein